MSPISGTASIPTAVKLLLKLDVRQDQGWWGNGHHGRSSAQLGGMRHRVQRAGCTLCFRALHCEVVFSAVEWANCVAGWASWLDDGGGGDGDSTRTHILILVAAVTTENG